MNIDGVFYFIRLNVLCYNFQKNFTRRSFLQDKVLAAIQQHKLLDPGDSIVVAVSGGADSTALLHLLDSLQQYRLKIIVAHLNHLLRGSESDGDEEFVRLSAVRYGYKFVVRRVDITRFALEKGLSLEEAGRECRYSFFDDIAAEHRAKTVALAHHADDQAETVLMRLLRGSAATGLCGMSVSTADGRYIRPLLGVRRSEIQAYLTDHGLSYRIDSSNCDTGFLRNRIRHTLIPLLQEYNPAISERLAATAESLAADEELLDSLTGDLVRKYAAVSTAGIAVPAAGVLTEPAGARLRLYRQLIGRVKGDLRRISRQHLCDIDRFLHDPKPHGTLILPDEVTVWKSYGSIFFALHLEKEVSEAVELIIEGPGEYAFPGGYLLTVEMDSCHRQCASLPQDRARFDLGKAPFPWLVRTFRDGDRFVPSGMSGRKKVKDLFIDMKIPRDDRRRIPLIFSGHTLLWVCGLRSSAAAPVTDNTQAIANVRMELQKP